MTFTRRQEKDTQKSVRRQSCRQLLRKSDVQMYDVIALTQVNLLIRLQANDAIPANTIGNCANNDMVEKNLTFRGRPTRSQERLTSVQRSTERTRAKSSRSWSPSDVRGNQCGSGESSSYSPSPSDAHSSSDSDSLKRPSTAETLRRAFQTFKISSKWESKKKHAKKSPKRILRSPVSYTYVRGLSGLPTQRVPKNATQQLMMSCTCQDSIGLYR
ncbi:hypothetical protein M0802_005358 [Mischocyttarus mexicanus]|nr:hypothetical protein M0802_005358 [Mischocyttarus mexicanus]